MNSTQEKALFHLAGQNPGQAAGTKALRELVAAAPYFAPAHFLLTASMKRTHPYEQWMPHAQKTNLYFTNPRWLQFQLEEAEHIHAAGQAQPEAATRITLPESEEATDQEGDADETDAPQADSQVEDGADSKIAGILSNQLADFRKPLDPGATLEIDADKKPLHTVDYFVSQGIRVDLAAMPQDKLTTHLRKFTDWLKQVKNAQAAGNPKDLGTTPEMEKAVAETARNSNETREILTESMADVLVKQGQVEKAIQLYIKLSFINPEKSSYFAAKIEQLKGI